MPKLYIGNQSNSPTRLKKLFIGDSNNSIKKIKKVWIGDQNNNPKLIFTEGLPDGYLYDYSAIDGQYNQSQISAIINSVNGSPHQIQQKYGALPSSKVWGLSSWNGRPKSFNNLNTDCGRGGTFRLPNPVSEVTLLIVQRLSLSAIAIADSFTNCCYFNEKGDYQYADDYYYYTGETIGSLSFRKLNNRFFTSSFSEGQTDFINEKLCVYWFYTQGNEIITKIKAVTGESVRSSVQKTSNKLIQDIRICDWAGGGVEALTGELYEFVIWPKLLSEEERAETEDFIFEKWS